jgi:Uma2 family endonuclease
MRVEVEMTITSRSYTAEELFDLPDNGGRNELLNGELVAMSPINQRHWQVAARILYLLQRFLEDHPVGEAGMELGCILARNPDVVLAPDVVFIRAARIATGALPERFFEGAPDLAVEVLSPSESAQEIETKLEKYLDAETPLVWIVNPKTQSVAVYQHGAPVKMLKQHDVISGEQILAGFSCKVGEFFAARL